MKGNIKFVIFNISSQWQKKGLAIFPPKKKPFLLILIKAIAIKVLDHLCHCVTLENNYEFKPWKEEQKCVRNQYGRKWMND